MINGYPILERKQDGMSDTKIKQMNDFLKVQNDWYTHCVKCGKKLMGLTTDIMAHTERCHGKVSQ